VTIIHGRSGVGKSTLLNLIAGYLRPDSGTVKRPGGVAYLMQEELLFSELTVVDNLRLRLAGTGIDAGSDVIDDTLEVLGIEPLRANPVSRLSGGERRRVEMAAILATAPAVVLLDEPTAGLDPHNRDTVYDAAWRCFADRTVIVATHEEELRNLPPCSRHLTLEDGRLA
jgi:ABC-type lipoprotein export system ATPase subunit